MRHDLTLTDGPYTLRPLLEADFGPLMALAQAHAAEYAHMAVHPGTLPFYQGGLDAPDQMVFVKLVQGPDGQPQYAGSTRYLEMRPSHRGLEIGSTWLAPAFMRSGANWAFKRLAMAHAFEELGMARVQIKTDIRNVRSQTAIERLGAVREGVLRQHMLRPDGTMRDTVMYSVTQAEWPEMKARLGAGPV
ncbi:GNAT family N-acetyltransferase [Deinococcus sp. UYEF24]